MLGIRNALYSLCIRCNLPTSAQTQPVLDQAVLLYILPPVGCLSLKEQGRIWVENAALKAVWADTYLSGLEKRVGAAASWLACPEMEVHQGDGGEECIECLPHVDEMAVLL